MRVKARGDGRDMRFGLPISLACSVQIEHRGKSLDAQPVTAR